MKTLILSWLLYKANQLADSRFYDLKNELLEKYGTPDGEDLQYIERECWGDDWDIGCSKDYHCRSCGGSGIYMRRWITLHRFTFGKYHFHRPGSATAIRPKDREVTITGRVKKDSYSRPAREAFLWLMLLTGRFKTLLTEFKSQRPCTGWRLFPLTTIGILIFESQSLAGRCADCNRLHLGRARAWPRRCKCCHFVRVEADRRNREAWEKNWDPNDVPF